MTHQFVKQITENFTDVMSMEDNRKKLEENVIDPLIHYILDRLYPYIFFTATIFVLILLLAIVILILILKK